MKNHSLYSSVALIFIGGSITEAKAGNHAADTDEGFPHFLSPPRVAAVRPVGAGFRACGTGSVLKYSDQFNSEITGNPVPFLIGLLPFPVSNRIWW